MNIIYKPCNICESSGGKYITKTNEQGDEYVEKCKCYSDYLYEKTLFLNLVNSGLNANFIYDYKLSEYIGSDDCNIKEKATKYINKFDEVFYNKSLYLYGTNGTQKSTISNYIGKELIKKNKKVILILMNTLLNELKENFHKDKEDLDDYDIWYNDLVNCDLLIIDDAFDKKSLVYKSGYQITYLDTLLRTRLERTGKSIIFTSNTNIEDIDEEKFSLSIKELVKRNTLNCVFEMKDKVDRLQKDFNVDDLWS